MAIIFENSLGNLFMAIVLENSVRQSVAEEFSARSRYQRARFVAAFDRVQIAVQRRHEFRVETVFEGIVTESRLGEERRVKTNTRPPLMSAYLLLLLLRIP